MNHRLVEGSVEECLEGVARPAEIECLLPFGLHSVPLCTGGVGRAQISVEHLSEALQVSEEFAGVDHERGNPNSKIVKGQAALRAPPAR